MANNRVCAGPGCDRTELAAKGLCGAHYAQRQRGQPMRPLQSPSTKKQKIGLRIGHEAWLRLQSLASRKRTTAYDLASRMLTAAISKG